MFSSPRQAQEPRRAHQLRSQREHGRVEAQGAEKDAAGRQLEDELVFEEVRSLEGNPNPEKVPHEGGGDLPGGDVRCGRGQEVHPSLPRRSSGEQTHIHTHAHTSLSFSLFARPDALFLLFAPQKMESSAPQPKPRTLSSSAQRSNGGGGGGGGGLDSWGDWGTNKDSGAATTTSGNGGRQMWGVGSSSNGGGYQNGAGGGGMGGGVGGAPKKQMWGVGSAGSISAAEYEARQAAGGGAGGDDLAEKFMQQAQVGLMKGKEVASKSWNTLRNSETTGKVMLQAEVGLAKGKEMATKGWSMFMNTIKDITADHEEPGRGGGGGGYQGGYQQQSYGETSGFSGGGGMGGGGGAGNGNYGSNFGGFDSIGVHKTTTSAPTSAPVAKIKTSGGFGDWGSQGSSPRSPRSPRKSLGAKAKAKVDDDWGTNDW